MLSWVTSSIPETSLTYSSQARAVRTITLKGSSKTSRRYVTNRTSMYLSCWESVSKRINSTPVSMPRLLWYSSIPSLKLSSYLACRYLGERKYKASWVHPLFKEAWLSFSARLRSQPLSSSCFTRSLCRFALRLSTASTVTCACISFSLDSLATNSAFMDIASTIAAWSEMWTEYLSFWMTTVPEAWCPISGGGSLNDGCD